MNSYQKFINNFMNQYGNNPDNKMNNELFDDYQGFIRGNMFKNLYDPYKIKQPYEIKPMNEQADLLTRLDALSFAMIDLGLYLDIHPMDRDALTVFNKYREEKKSILKKYEDSYGPITLDSDSLNNYPWAWINMPWPWEG